MTFSSRQRVLVDTNVIIEAHRAGCWNAIAQYFHLETVEKVIEETQTGAHNRPRESLIDETILRASMRHVATITDAMRAEFSEKFPTALLDDGERDLIIYAGTLNVGELWLLNSPDKAAVRHANSRTWLDRVVSLEAMNSHLKVKPKDKLKTNYSEDWLARLRTQLLLGGI